MPTYSYMSNMPSVRDTVEGITFLAGVAQNFQMDQRDLNRHVPARLNRYVDGVLSNTDLVIPTARSAQETAEAKENVSINWVSAQYYGVRAGLADMTQQMTLAANAAIEDGKVVVLPPGEINISGEIVVTSMQSKVFQTAAGAFSAT